MPGDGTHTMDRCNFIPTSDEVDNINELFENSFKVPNNFEITSQPYDPQRESERDLSRTPFPHPKVNKQTETICEKLKIDDPIKIIIEGKKRNNSDSDANIVSISDLACESKTDAENEMMPEFQSNNVSYNADEIPLDDENDDLSDNGIVSVEEKSSNSTIPECTPKKAKLQLPEPKSESMVGTMTEMSLSSTMNFDGDTSEFHENLANVEDSNAIANFNVNDNSDVAENPKKKLKRRNVAIYEDDSNE